MATDNNSWIAETVGDFIHSPIWGAPIYTFIEANCATFDYDDDDDVTEEDDKTPSSSMEEQRNIYQQYQRLVDALIEGLGKDLDLDQNELKKVCQLPTSSDATGIIDESFEQLYAARDFQLFQEMMRRKNLILQLQALVTLQLQWGLLKHSETGDDLVLSLLLQATSSPSQHGSGNLPTETIERPYLQDNEDKHHQNTVVDDDDDDDEDVVVVKQKQPSPSRKKREPNEPKKVFKEEYRLPDLRLKGGPELDAKWYRDLQQKTQKRDDNDDSNENNESKRTSTPQTIGAIPEEVLRDKLRELTVRTKSSVDNEAATAIESRKNFLQKQRNLIVNKQREERTRDLEQQTPNPRPQSAAHIARKAMATTNKANENKPEQQSTQIPEDELIKRRAMAAKLKREVVDKR
ncbi:unnamed protein product [Rotaria sp. Silwood2]|nr:unnamed protein product [Rotaria sp. Silwood2]CAF2668558.1 unnamed protein product [Rotaria sp. Silwood2]CAF2945754.1 unnamed protein product [Rotaria sp. Silwood2]CAF3103358.1 unnamed protein product [Rotaria sp. Silwood2]CAF4160093.1 unnamed protein product [Rotaria sp. Silwood2]